MKTSLLLGALRDLSLFEDPEATDIGTDDESITTSNDSGEPESNPPSEAASPLMHAFSWRCTLFLCCVQMTGLNPKMCIDRGNRCLPFVCDKS